MLMRALLLMIVLPLLLLSGHALAGDPDRDCASIRSVPGIYYALPNGPPVKLRPVGWNQLQHNPAAMFYIVPDPSGGRETVWNVRMVTSAVDGSRSNRVHVS